MRLVQSTALHDLVVTRGGRPPSAMPITDEPSTEMRLLLRTDPKLAWVAIEDGRLIGQSVGFVRGELWFLADLFVLPNAQAKGVGAELLNRCLGAGLERGATVRAVMSSGDPSAQVLYIRAGMVPRFPLFGFEGAAHDLCKLPAVSTTIWKVEPSKVWIRKLGDLDEKIWGRRRDREHRYWLDEYKFICLAIVDASGGMLGYAYCSSVASPPPWNCDPHRIGPVAATSAKLQLPLLRAIGDAMAAERAKGVEFQIPGINMTVLSALIEAGFKIDHVGQFMSSRAFGRFDRYMPSGGTLL